MKLGDNHINEIGFWPAALLLSVICTILSVAITGFQFGIINNVFHIPYVLDLAKDPVFAENAFYLTLDKFTSIIWPIVKVFANEDNIKTVFFLFFVLSRFLAFLGLAYLLYINGLKQIWLFIATLVFAVTPFFQGTSPIGGHGQFIYYLTHSEFTWGPIFFALAFLQQRRILLSTVMVSLTFSMNVFIGIWLAFIGLVSVAFYKQPITLSNSIKAIGIFGITASPVIYWVASSILHGAEVDFSYIEYIRQYHKYHFLIEGAKPEKIAALSVLFLSGVMATFYTTTQRYWLGLLVGALVLFSLGIVLPYLINDRFIFNLHLIRSDGLAQAIAIILSVIASIELLKNSENKYSRLLGLIAFASLTTIIWDPLRYADLVLVLAALSLGLIYKAEQLPKLLQSLLSPFKGIANGLTFLLLLSFAALSATHIIVLSEHMSLALLLRLLLFVVTAYLCFETAPKQTLIKLALLSIIALSVCTSILNRLDGLSVSDRFMDATAQDEKAEQREDWKELLSSIRQSDLSGEFLIPISDLESGFQLYARRPVWVDWRQGAAVMWEPSFYDQWKKRFDEVGALETQKQIFDYASANQIKNIVFREQIDRCRAPYQATIKTDFYSICSMR